jgi:hypothetical protein
LYCEPLARYKGKIVNSVRIMVVIF